MYPSQLSLIFGFELRYKWAMLLTFYSRAVQDSCFDTSAENQFWQILTVAFDPPLTRWRVLFQTLTRYPVSPRYTLTLGWALLCWRAHCLQHKTRVQLTPIDTPVYVLHHWHRSHGHTAGGGIEGKDWPPTEGGKLFGLDPTLFGQIGPGEKGLAKCSNLTGHMALLQMFSKLIWCRFGCWQTHSKSSCNAGCLVQL